MIEMRIWPRCSISTFCMHFFSQLLCYCVVSVYVNTNKLSLIKIGERLVTEEKNQTTCLTSNLRISWFKENPQQLPSSLQMAVSLFSFILSHIYIQITSLILLGYVGSPFETTHFLSLHRRLDRRSAFLCSQLWGFIYLAQMYICRCHEIWQLFILCVTPMKEKFTKVPIR